MDPDAVPTIHFRGLLFLVNRMIRFALVTSLLVLVGAGIGFAQPRIGVIDIGVILEQSLAAQEADEMLQAFVAERQQAVDELEVELDALQEQLSQLDEGEERTSLQAQFDEQLAAMRQQVQRFEEEINAVLEDFRGQLLSDIQIVLQMFGSENGYDIIMDASSLGFFSDAVDVTDAVIEMYDALLLESRSLAE